ncbi:hypothetical protein Celaphus_00003941 [Cervus elaphus hippelaphus]|uniref:Ubiquitin-like domain-containing protein n=1 Tax=Cervus elaphus hippelaphus TaxID=46360 RepID=A0A212DBI7_CEREH|nr:hypothetical protein Celaphus_00003941 [Cervus elaphus hippelaphus]
MPYHMTVGCGAQGHARLSLNVGGTEPGQAAPDCPPGLRAGALLTLTGPIRAGEERLSQRQRPELHTPGQDTVTGQETIAQIKVHVALLEGIAPEDQVLLLAGTPLEDEATLGQCGVEALSTLEGDGRSQAPRSSCAKRPRAHKPGPGGRAGRAGGRGRRAAREPARRANAQTVTRASSEALGGASRRSPQGVRRRRACHVIERQCFRAKGSGLTLLGRLEDRGLWPEATVTLNHSPRRKMMYRGRDASNSLGTEGLRKMAFQKRSGLRRYAIPNRR